MSMGCADEAIEQARAAVLGGGLSLLFQPIRELQGGVLYGYEALVRGPSGSLVYDASALTWAVDRAGCQEEFCCEVVRLVLEAALPAGAKIFLNLDDAAAGIKAFEGCSCEPKGIVLEITERLWRDKNGLRCAPAVKSLQDRGFKVAIDDVNMAMDFASALACRPDYIKLDMAAVSALAISKQERVKAAYWIKRFHEIGAAVIAEGIDTEAKLEAVREVGADYGQGYLLGMPACMVAHPSPADSVLSRDGPS